jgi:hypothetical protein
MTCEKCGVSNKTVMSIHGRKRDDLVVRLLCLACAKEHYGYPEYIVDCPHCEAEMPV